MVVLSTTDVPLNYTWCQSCHSFFCYYWPWYQCTRTCYRSIIWLQLHLKKFLLQLTSTVKLPGEIFYDKHMVMHTGTHTSDVSLTREYQKHMSTTALKHGVIDQDKYKKQATKKLYRKVILFSEWCWCCAKICENGFVIKTSLHHCHFLVHTQNHMVSEGWIRIEIYYLIQNWDMEYAQYYT